MEENSVHSILEALSVNASLNPDKLCVGDKKNKASYKEFWQMVKRGACFLKSSGLRQGDMVVIRGLQRIEYPLAVFSVQLAGGAVCPLERAIKDDRITEIMIFVDSSIYISDRKPKFEDINFIKMSDLYDFAVDDNEELNDFNFPSDDDMSEILFTTGTTGKSKGIVVTHGTNIAIAQNVIDSVGMCADERELITTPINHSLAMRRMYGGIYNSSSVILTDGVKFIEDFFKLLDGYEITAVTFVPAILEQLLKFAKDRFASYNNQLHYIQLGSAPLSEANKKILAKMFPDLRLYNTYGATESGCTIILEFSKYLNKSKCIGRTTVNSTVIFVDEDRKEIDASAENPGYLAFIGKMNMKEYYKEPLITSQVLSNGIIYTNDLGYRGDDGLIYLLGRKGDVINMGGIKIAPTEIEEVVMQSGMVKDCACIPIPDEITGEAPKLFVSLNDGDDFDQRALSKYMLEKLESLKVPKVFETVDEIPRTFNGKIIRKQLIEREANKR